MSAGANRCFTAAVRFQRNYLSLTLRLSVETPLRDGEAREDRLKGSRRRLAAAAHREEQRRQRQQNKTATACSRAESRAPKWQWTRLRAAAEGCEERKRWRQTQRAPQTKFATTERKAERKGKAQPEQQRREGSHQPRKHDARGVGTYIREGRSHRPTAKHGGSELLRTARQRPEEEGGKARGRVCEEGRGEEGRRDGVCGGEESTECNPGEEYVRMTAVIRPRARSLQRVKEGVPTDLGGKRQLQGESDDGGDGKFSSTDMVHTVVHEQTL